MKVYLVWSGAQGDQWVPAVFARLEDAEAFRKQAWCGDWVEEREVHETVRAALEEVGE